MIKPTLKQLLPFIILVFGGGIFIILIMTKPASISTPIKERSWNIQTQEANPKTLSPSLILYGQIETSALVQAAAPEKSRVASLNVREGEPIINGQLLLTLDQRDFKPRLNQAEARVAELEALIQSELSRFKSDTQAYAYEKSIVNLEQSAVKRATNLKNRKLGSTAELEQAQGQLKRQQLALVNRAFTITDHDSRLQQLKARLAHSKADVELAQLDLERSKIIAPFDGFVEKLLVATGDQVNANQILLSLYSTEQLEIRAKIPVSFQNEIQKALLNNQQLEALADYGGSPLKLTLNRLAGTADARGIDALFEIESGNEWVRLGSTISLRLQRPKINNVITLPYSALYDNNLIYRVKNNRLESVKAKVVGNYIKNQQEKLLVFSTKIQQGDEIMITHLPNAISGLKVELSNNPQ